MVAVESTENELPTGTQVLRRYSVVGKLAQGGMAEVYLARQVGPAGYQKLVVIKRVRPHLANDEDFVGMFVNEARLAAMINHPNVVQIFDLGDEPRPKAQGGGQDWFLAMEYLDGRDMLQVGRACRAHNKAVPFDVTARIIADACAGLDYAHGLKSPDGKSLDLVHRDMSPENVLITFEGQVKVVDFGIAKASDNLIKTQAGQIKGKLGYVAPEAILGKPVDARADVFAIGATLYLFLSGRPAFTGTNPMEIFERSLKPPTPPREVNNRVPEALDAICMKALAQDREKRYRSAGEVRVALEGYLQSTGRPLGPAQLSQFMRILFPPDKDPVRQRIDKLLADAPAVEVKRSPTLPPMQAPLPVPAAVTTTPLSKAPAPVSVSEPDPVYIDDEKTNIVTTTPPMEASSAPDPVTLNTSRPAASRTGGPAHLRSMGVADVSLPSGTPVSVPPPSRPSPAMADMTFDDLQLRTVPGEAAPPTMPVKRPPPRAPAASIEIDDDFGDIDVAGALAESDELDTIDVPAPMAANRTGVTAARANSVEAVAAALHGFTTDDNDVGPPPPLEASLPTPRPPRTELDEPMVTVPSSPPPAWSSLPPLPSAPVVQPPAPPAAFAPPPASFGAPPEPPAPAPPSWSPMPPSAPPTFVERGGLERGAQERVPTAITAAPDRPGLGLRLAMLGFGALTGCAIVLVALAATGTLSRIVQ